MWEEDQVLGARPTTPWPISRIKVPLHALIWVRTISHFTAAQEHYLLQPNANVGRDINE